MTAATINSILSKHAQICGCSLEWRGAPIAADEVFDNGHLMPVVTMFASIKGLQLMGWDLDVANNPSKDGLIGLTSTIPAFEKSSVNDTIRGLFYMHAAEKVFGLSRGGVIECFPVFEYFKLDLHQRAVQANRYTSPLAKQTHRNSMT